jgi:hydroxymethylpyrimidine kinase/phosphomethylpyrimidine kinase
VVLDPILVSSSGAALLDAGGVQVLKDRLLAWASVVTPNLDEAEVLTGLKVRDLQQMRRAAVALREMGARAAVVKGGHLEGDETVDLLLDREGFHELRGERIRSRATHGTGCAFATALACNLALGLGLPAATARAKEYVRRAIVNAYPLGRGKGPMNHLFPLEKPFV